jgi:arylsulfatase A-like enzyme
MAQDGVVMENLRTTSPLCSPARSSLFTGFQPHQAGIPHLPYGNQDIKEEERSNLEITKPPIAHYLREAGYQCLYAGKWHLGSNNIQKWFDWFGACDDGDRSYTEWCRWQGVADGFIFHDDKRSHPFRSVHYPKMSIPRTGVLDIPADKEHNAWILGHAFELFGLRDDRRPFFLCISMEGPHPPLVVPRAFYDLYDPDEVPEPKNWQPSEGEPDFLATSYYRRLRHEWGDDFSAWRKSIAVYWGYTTYIDSLFGALVRRLEECQLLDNTVIAMVSDHGEMMGQHGLWQKFCPYEEALRVPWVLRWPGRIKPGRSCRMDVSHVDVAATLLAAGGVEVDALSLEGENLLPYLADDRPKPAARDCFAQYNVAPDFRPWHGVESWRALIRKPWKYVLHQNGEVELYNHLDDPFELKNLARDPAAQEAVETLQKAVLAWCRRTGDQFLKQLTLRSEAL